MSQVTLSPTVLRGRVRVPPSKSQAHRSMICAALSGGRCSLSPFALSKDMEATLRALSALGVSARLEGEVLTLESGVRPDGPVDIDCGESGSTLRFLIPIAAALGVPARFVGQGRLPERPIGVYLDCLPPAGVSCKTDGGLPLTVSGRLRPGTFSLPGNISSQFITGLLFALPLLEGDSDIRLTTPLESTGYVDMTTETMARFGVAVERTPGGWHVPGRQRYRPRDDRIEGDWSQAAFFLAAGALGGETAVEGLSPRSAQGDRAIEALLKQFGASLRWEGDVLIASPGALHGTEIDAAQIPDLVPILAAVAALSAGETRLTGCARLRIKESDRLTAIADGLSRLGAQVREEPDGLMFRGVPSLSGGKAAGYNDHRIVMALSVAALRADAPVTLTDAQSIQKSYPLFFEDYNRLGGKAHVFDVG